MPGYPEGCARVVYLKGSDLKDLKSTPQQHQNSTGKTSAAVTAEYTSSTNGNHADSPVTENHENIDLRKYDEDGYIIVFPSAEPSGQRPPPKIPGGVASGLGEKVRAGEDSGPIIGERQART